MKPSEQPPGVRCVISDLGKVLLWFDNSLFFRRMAERTALSWREIAELFKDHRDLLEAFDTGRCTADAFYRAAIRILGADVSRAEFFRMYNDVFSLNPGVLDLFRKVKESRRLVLLSNTDEERFGFVRRQFPEILIFDAYVLSYEVGFRKPDPRIYREALRAAGVGPEACVFIDDLEENISAARNLGLGTVHYRPQTDLSGELMKAGLAL